LADYLENLTEVMMNNSFEIGFNRQMLVPMNKPKPTRFGKYLEVFSH